MNELVYLQQMFGGMAGGGSQGGGWMAIVMLVVLVLICLYKPERIHSHVLFRWTCSFFVLSLILPSVVQLGLLAFAVGPQMGGGRSPRNSGQGFGTFFGIVGVIQRVVVVEADWLPENGSFDASIKKRVDLMT